MINFAKRAATLVVGVTSRRAASTVTSPVVYAAKKPAAINSTVVEASPLRRKSIFNGNYTSFMAVPSAVDSETVVKASVQKTADEIHNSGREFAIYADLSSGGPKR